MLRESLVETEMSNPYSFLSHHPYGIHSKFKNTYRSHSVILEKSHPFIVTFIHIMEKNTKIQKMKLERKVIAHISDFYNKKQNNNNRRNFIKYINVYIKRILYKENQKKLKSKEKISQVKLLFFTFIIRQSFPSSSY